MRNTAFFLVGLLLVFLQSNLFRLIAGLTRIASSLLMALHITSHPVAISGLTPSLVLPLILFMGVHEYSLARGASVAFVLGYLTDLIGISPIGLHAFTYVALFTLARSAGVRLAAQTKMLQVVLAASFALVHSIVLLVLLAIFGRDAWVPRTIYPLVFPHVVTTGLIAPLVFTLSQRVHAATNSGARAAEDGAG